MSDFDQHLRRQEQHLDFLIDQMLRGRTIMSSSQPPARPRRRHHWGEAVYRELRLWRQADQRAAARRAEESALIVTQAEFAARPGQRALPAWAEDTTTPEPTGPPTTAPGGRGCAGCGVATATRWLAIGTRQGHPRALCGECTAELAAAGDTLGREWRDRLACRAAGLLPGSGYTDFAKTIGFRIYMEVARDGGGDAEPFAYLGEDLRRLRSFARINWPERLRDKTKRAAYVAIKEAGQDRERAKQQSPSAAGRGMLTLRPVSRPGPRWGAR